MHLFTHSLSTPEQNLALEEAWLEMAEEGLLDTEILRLWRPESSFVVVGRGSQIAREVNVTAAEQAGVPILRRVSGGAAVVAAEGCLMYAVLLSYQQRPHLRMLDHAHRTVMESLTEAIRPLESRLQWDGTCDLVVSSRKVSGNSLRCRRDWLLYHGTLLLGMDLTLLDRFLLHPPREPEYRQRRPHTEFVANLNLPESAIRDELIRVWGAGAATPPVPHDRIERLVRERYANRAWNFER
jgi:lipoate-protein ligase A